MTHTRLKLLSLGMAVAVAACGSDPMDPDPDPDPDPRVVLTAPSFATDINEIFVRTGCTASGCHGAAGGRAGLMLTSDAPSNWSQLVNIPATSETFMRVLPNDTVNSYLVIKLEGRQTVGQQMPRGGAPLDTIDMNNIKNWIKTGAPNN